MSEKKYDKSSDLEENRILENTENIEYIDFNEDVTDIREMLDDDTRLQNAEDVFRSFYKKEELLIGLNISLYKADNDTNIAYPVNKGIVKEVKILQQIDNNESYFASIEFEDNNTIYTTDNSRKHFNGTYFDMIKFNKYKKSKGNPFLQDESLYNIMYYDDNNPNYIAYSPAREFNSYDVFQAFKYVHSLRGLDITLIKKDDDGNSEEIATGIVTKFKPSYDFSRTKIMFKNDPKEYLGSEFNKIKFNKYKQSKGDPLSQIKFKNGGKKNKRKSKKSKKVKRKRKTRRH